MIFIESVVVELTQSGPPNDAALFCSAIPRYTTYYCFCFTLKIQTEYALGNPAHVVARPCCRYIARGLLTYTMRCFSCVTFFNILLLVTAGNIFDERPMIEMRRRYQQDVTTTRKTARYLCCILTRNRNYPSKTDSCHSIQGEHRVSAHPV